MALCVFISFFPEIALFVHVWSQPATKEVTTIYRSLGTVLLYILALDLISYQRTYGLRSRLAVTASAYITLRKFTILVSKKLLKTVALLLIGVIVFFASAPFIKMEIKPTDMAIALFTAVLVYIEYRRYSRETMFPMVMVEEPMIRDNTVYVNLRGANTSNWSYVMSIDMFVPEYGKIDGEISLRQHRIGYKRTVIISSPGKIERKAVFQLDDKVKEIFEKEKKVPVVFEIIMERSDGEKKWIPAPKLIETSKPKVESMV